MYLLGSEFLEAFSNSLFCGWLFMRELYPSGNRAGGANWIPL